MINYYYYFLKYHRKWRYRGLKTKIKNKLEWLRVGIVLNWESLVKEDFLLLLIITIIIISTTVTT